MLPHRECVDCLIEVIQCCDGLDDMVIILLHRELDFGSTVGMSKAQLCSFDVCSLVRSVGTFSILDTYPHPVEPLGA